jgi:hypothetical protein
MRVIEALWPLLLIAVAILVYVRVRRGRRKDPGRED